MLPGNTNPVQKITITRFVNILTRPIDLIREPNRSGQLTTTDPRSAVAGFPFLPPTPDQRASYHTIPKGDSALELPWVPDLSSPHRVAPIEVTADRWTTSSLVVPPMVPLAMPTWNEERGTPTRGGLQLTMSPGFIQACNTTSLSQCDIIPQTTYHTPFYFSANIPVQSQDKENHKQYVDWNRSEFSLIGRVDHDSLSPILRQPTTTPRRTTNWPVSPTRRTQRASPLAKTIHCTSGFPLKLVVTRLMRVASIRIGCPLVKIHPRGPSDNKHPAESVGKHSSASTTSPGISPQSPMSLTFRGYKSYPDSEEGKTSQSAGSRRRSRKE